MRLGSCPASASGRWSQRPRVPLEVWRRPARWPEPAHLRTYKGSGRPPDTCHSRVPTVSEFSRLAGGGVLPGRVPGRRQLCNAVLTHGVQTCDESKSDRRCALQRGTPDSPSDFCAVCADIDFSSRRAHTAVRNVLSSNRLLPGAFWVERELNRSAQGGSVTNNRRPGLACPSRYPRSSPERLCAS